MQRCIPCGAPGVAEDGDDASRGDAVDGDEGGLLGHIRAAQGAGVRRAQAQQQVLPVQQLGLRTTQKPL